MNLQQYALEHLQAVLFCSEAALLWVLANYSYPRDPLAEFVRGRPRWSPRWLLAVAVRSLFAGTLIVWLSHGRFGLALFTTLCALMLPAVRSRISPSYLAEAEIVGNLIFVTGGMALVLHAPAAPWRTPPPVSPISRQIAAIELTAAVVVYVLRGGTYIVRGLLEKGRILPQRSAPKECGTSRIDIAEYNRGRIIGNVERLILVIFVAIQAYPALAFLMAAKGLFRAKDLEKKEFSEYFLVGTLVSSLVAILAGLTIQVILKLLW